MTCRSVNYSLEKIITPRNLEKAKMTHGYNLFMEMIFQKPKLREDAEFLLWNNSLFGGSILTPIDNR
jgi:hypothetical protein